MIGDKASKISFNEWDYCKDIYYHSYNIVNGVDKSICM